MANQNAPFGFLEYLGGAGGAPTFSQSARRTAYDASAIYCGDPVQQDSTTGYIVQGDPSNPQAIAGIFVGCQYLSVSQKRTVWSRYWPGSDSANDVICYVVDDPNARFLVMGNGTTFNISGTPTSYGNSPVGQYAQFAIGSGNANTGSSGAYLNALGTTTTYPFIVVDLVVFPPGANGADPTSAYNNVVVGFNNQIMRTNGAGPTGIS